MDDSLMPRPNRTAMLAALERLVQSESPSPDKVRCDACADEGIGSARSRALIEETARQALAVLVLEPAASGGAIKTARKGIADFVLEVEGRAAHAGVEPEKGISAIEELAHQVLALKALADSPRGTTINVGVLAGGTRPN